jgi:hypothetical protein
MPLLMSDVNAGSDAIRSMQQNVIDQQYAPEKARMQSETAKLDLETKTMALATLKEAVSTDKDIQEAWPTIAADPANKDKSASENLFMLADLYKGKDPKKYEFTLDKATKMQKNEVTIAENKEKVERLALNRISTLAQNMNPEDPAAIEGLIMNSHVEGLTPDYYKADLQTVGPVQARDNLVARLKAYEQQKIDLAAQKETGRLDVQNKKIELDSKRLDAQMEHWDNQDKTRQFEADRKDKETSTKENKELITNKTLYFNSAKQYYTQYKAAWDKTNTPEKQQELTDTYYGRIDALNIGLGSRIKEKDGTFPLLEITGKTTADVAKERAEAKLYKIPVADGFVATQDQELSLQAGINKLRKNPSLRQEILNRLKSAGIKIREE